MQQLFEKGILIKMQVLVKAVTGMRSFRKLSHPKITGT
jgi:hypothetical protein